MATINPLTSFFPPLMLANYSQPYPMPLATGRPAFGVIQGNEAILPGARDIQGLSPIGPAPSVGAMPQNRMAINPAPRVNPQFTMQQMGQLPQMPQFPQVMPFEQPEVSTAPRQQVPDGEQLPFNVSRETTTMPAQPQQGRQSNALLYGLMAAGLGILANNYGRYGQAGPAIGIGGMQGLQTFMGQKQFESQEALREQQLAQQAARDQATIEYNRAMAGVAQGKAEREAREYAYMQGMLKQFREEKDPQKRMEILTEAAMASDADAALKTLLAAAPGRNIEKQLEGIPGQKGLQQYVARDRLTGEVLWKGEPYEKSSQTIVVGPQESKFQEKFGGGMGERAVEIQTQADKASNTLYDVNRMLDFAERWVSGGGQLGKLANVQRFATEAMMAMGLSPEKLGLPKDAGPAQALEAMSNSFVLSKIGNTGEGGMPANNFSNADLKFVTATKPQVINTPEGFILISMIERGAAHRALARDQMMAEEFANAPAGEKENVTYQRFRRKYLEWAQSTSAWTDQEKQEMQRLREILDGKTEPTPKGPAPWER